MRVICHLSDPGGGRCNEDLIGWCGNRVWVIDGGTDVAETIRPDDSISGSLWIARKLDGWLKACDASPPVALRGFAEIVKNEIKELDLEGVGVSPICSISIVEFLSQSVDIYSVGDVTVYAPDVNLEVRNPMFADNETTGVRMDRKNGGSSILKRRRGYLRGEQGWVLGGNPEVQTDITRIARSDGKEQSIMIASDGYMRASLSYSLYTSTRQVYDATRTLGPEAVVRMIRETEGSGALQCPESYKRSDDASVVLVAG